MSAENEESDRLPGFAHPRENFHLMGHEDAEKTFLNSWGSGKLPHAWLITGPPGVGKATLAYRIARFLLQDQAPGLLGLDSQASLYVDPGAHISSQIMSQSHTNLLVLKRPWDFKTKRIKTALTVDEVRNLNEFFALSAGVGGWRICLIDTADDMTIEAANALLKTLEEPPEKSLFLVLAHAPGRLLPTIRSRCRRLNLRPLEGDAFAAAVAAQAPDIAESTLGPLAQLAQGSVGRGLQLAAGGGLELYQEMLGLLANLPTVDMLIATDMANRLSRRGAENEFALFIDLLLNWIQSTVTGAARQCPPPEIAAGEAALRQNLFTPESLAGWVEAWTSLRQLREKSDALHLDKKQTFMQALRIVQRVSAGAARKIA